MTSIHPPGLAPNFFRELGKDYGVFFILFTPPKSDLGYSAQKNMQHTPRYIIVIIFTGNSKHTRFCLQSCDLTNLNRGRGGSGENGKRTPGYQPLENSLLTSNNAGKVLKFVNAPIQLRDLGECVSSAQLCSRREISFGNLCPDDAFRARGESLFTVLMFTRRNL